MQREYNGVEIGAYAKVYTNATILPGVKLGTGAVVGTGAIVTKSVDDFTLVTGIPAKVQRMRKFESENIEEMNQYMMKEGLFQNKSATTRDDTLTMKYELYIFDLDGTILDTEQDLAISVNYALSVFDFPTLSIGEVADRTGNGVKRLIEKSVPKTQTQRQRLRCWTFSSNIILSLRRPYETV